MSTTESGFDEQPPISGNDAAPTPPATTPVEGSTADSTTGSATGSTHSTNDMNQVNIYVS